jgi:hypothetical protein
MGRWEGGEAYFRTILRGSPTWSDGSMLSFG